MEPSDVTRGFCRCRLRLHGCRKLPRRLELAEIVARGTVPRQGRRRGLHLNGRPRKQADP
jgi:hypothetical protein